MLDPRERIKRLMGRVRQSEPLPASTQVVAETFERLGYSADYTPPSQVIDRFDEMLRKVWEETLVTLEDYEDRSYSRGIPREFIREFPEVFETAEEVSRREGFGVGVTRLFSELYPMFRRAFLSVQQGRMARGGRDFELQIEGLFDLAEIPYHRQESEHHTDLILPSLRLHESNRTISAVVSVKRTLRERWAEVAEELFNLRSPNVFLFTADENVSENHVSRICGQYNIYLVVWDRMKARKFPESPLVLGYTEWATKRLSVLREYWA